jgi:hypothetical protein
MGKPFAECTGWRTGIEVADPACNVFDEDFAGGLWLEG